MKIELIIEHFYQLTNVPVCLYQNNKLLVERGYDNYFKAYHDSILSIFLSSAEEFCHQLTKESLLYGFLNLNEAGAYVVLGPVARDKDLNLLASNLSSALKCSLGKELWNHCQKIPQYSQHSFMAQIQTFYAAMHREGYCKEHPLLYLNTGKDTDNKNPQNEVVQLMNHTIESQMLACIEYGKKDELRDILKFNIQYADPPAYDNSSMIRTYKNVFIASATLCSRAAIRGGMDYDLAISTSDKYISKVELFNTLSEIELELIKMIIWYTEQVASIVDFSQSSPLVKKTVAYIQAHIDERLTVNDISAHLHQNPSYLSHYFKAQTGETINNYITREKINKSKRLLIGSNLSLLEISSQLSFSSQQYFQSVFKKNVGMTPTEFRNQTNNR